MNKFRIEDMTQVGRAEDGSLVVMEFRVAGGELVQLEIPYRFFDRFAETMVALQNAALDKQREVGQMQAIDEIAVHVRTNLLRVVPNTITRDLILQVQGERLTTPSPHSPLGIQLSLEMAPQLIAHLQNAISVLSGHSTKQ